MAAKGNISVSKGSNTSKTANSSSPGGGGGYRGLKDMVDGGGPGRSGPKFSGGSTSGIANALGVRPVGSSGSSDSSRSTRPQARPAVLTSGTGSDKRYIDTRTGQSYSSPDYSPFSFRGLTSTDPANVLRNREAAARYATMRDSSDSSGGSSGIASLFTGQGRGRNTPAASGQSLANLGAPTTPMAPVEVATPTYGLPSIPPSPGAQPALSYGAAFAPSPASPGMSYADYAALMDIFGPQVDLSFMYS